MSETPQLPPHAQQLLSRLESALNQNTLDAGLQAGEKLTQLCPSFATGWLFLSEIYRRRRNLEKALTAIRKGVSILPNNPHYVAQLAFCLLSTGNFSEVDKVLTSALSLRIDDTWSLDTLGIAAISIDEHHKAIHFYTKATELAPRDARFLHNLATSQIIMGDTRGAEKNLKRALSVNPNFGKAHWSLSLISKNKGTPDAAQLQCVIDSPSASIDDRIHACFTLGKYYEGHGEFDKSFQAYELGNSTKRKQIRFSIDAERERFATIKQAFCDQWFSQTSTGNLTHEPIFVIGMPRTGTTLVESILGAHPDVHAAGELRNFGLSVKQLANTSLSPEFDIQTINASKGIPLDKLGKNYIDSIRPHSGHTRHFVDKNPLNFLYVALIAKSMPHAKIIHLSRNAMDTCFSNYKQIFSASGYFSYDLKEIAEYYLLYKNLLDYWQQYIPERICTVSYEELVNDQEMQTRRMLDFCELPWNNSCLNFFNSGNKVTTASVMQVRNPVYTSSIGKWKRFEKHLQPAMETLTSAGINFT